jgi:hypothetical protein
MLALTSFATSASRSSTSSRKVKKGTGAAADTGVRYAIAHGATHIARTDADCLPDPDWIGAIRQAFDDGFELAVGAVLPRREPEADSTLRYAWLVTCLAGIAVFYSIRLDQRKDHEYLGPYVMIAGGNMAITGDLYERCGGFSRTSIEDAHEDYDLLTAVRQITRAYARRPRMRVRVSLRRVHAWGLRRTVQWYARTDKAVGFWEGVDVR